MSDGKTNSYDNLNTSDKSKLDNYYYTTNKFSNIYEIQRIRNSELLRSEDDDVLFNCHDKEAEDLVNSFKYFMSDVVNLLPDHLTFTLNITSNDK